MQESAVSKKRIAIVGAGPIGMETALAARALDWPAVVYERDGVAANLAAWGHVRLFSPFAMNHSELGASLLCDAGHELPAADAYLTASEYRRAYLEPLARLPILRGVIREGCEVVSIGRAAHLKGDLSPGRAAAPFRLLVKDRAGTERVESADVVVDASGTYRTPNALGAGGIACPGEAAAADRISRGLDDILGADRARYAGKRVLLVGGGHSAATSAMLLAQLAGEAPGTEVLWVSRSRRTPLYTIDPNDPLLERRAVGEAGNRISGAGTPGVSFRSGLEVVEIGPAPGGALRVRLAGEGGELQREFDRIVSNVGFGPERRIYTELQVHECYATFGPMKLAAALLDASSNCLDQTTHGVESLVHPEPGFFILGMKSYGRNPSFLIRVGIEQIRDLFRLLAANPELDVTARPLRPGTSRVG